LLSHWIAKDSRFGVNFFLRKEPFIMAKKSKKATKVAEVTTPAVSSSSSAKEKKEEKLLSAEAFKLRQSDRRIPWADIYSAFKGQNNVSAEAYLAFREKWVKKNGDPDYFLTPEALSAYKKLFHRGPSHDEAEEIKRLTGKSYGVTPEDLAPFFEKVELDLGLELDGEPVTCSIHFGRFQPRTRFLTDRETGQVRTRKDGTAVRIGNFVALPKTANYNELKEKGAVVFEGMLSSTESLVVLAVCDNCRRAHLAGTRTFSRADAVSYVERQMKREKELVERAESVLSTIGRRRGRRDSTPRSWRHFARAETSRKLRRAEDDE
jgi:hypothetical protein